MSEHLLDQIRSSKPTAPEALRERVRSLAVAEPRREPLLRRLTPRRLVLVAPLTLVLFLLGAGALSVLPRGVDEQQSVSGGGAVGATTVESSTNALEAAPAQGQPLQNPAADAALAPTPGRLQRVDAEMRLRVEGLEDLSSATKRAMRVAQSLGGFVASVQYDAPAKGVGGAQIVLRVPTARFQTAIAQLSALGTILGQRIGIEDLQGSANELTDQIVDTQRRVAQLRRQLESTALGDEERAVLQARLAEARRQLADLQTALRGTRAEASFATIQLSLTTEVLAPVAAEEGRLDRVGEILAWEGTALLYVLVVAAPFVLLGLLLWLVLRLRRRAEEARLLERA